MSHLFNILSYPESQIFSLTGEYTTDDICKGLDARAVRAQVDTSVYAERWRLRLFSVYPLEDLLLQQQWLSILLFNQFAEGDAMFQAMRKVLFED